MNIKKTFPIFENPLGHYYDWCIIITEDRVYKYFPNKKIEGEKYRTIVTAEKPIDGFMVFNQCDRHYIEYVKKHHIGEIIEDRVEDIYDSDPCGRSYARWEDHFYKIDYSKYFS